MGGQYPSLNVIRFNINNTAHNKMVLTSMELAITDGMGKTPDYSNKCHCILCLVKNDILCA